METTSLSDFIRRSSLITKNNISMELEMYINFNYSFTSYIGEIEGSRYVQSVKIDIVNTDEGGYNPEVIGVAMIKVLLLEQAINDRYSIYEIFDQESYLRYIGDLIYNYDEGEFSDNIINAFSGIFNLNICILERILILPKYRGFGIGAKLIKDIYMNFGSACGLFVVQPFPLQLEHPGALRDSALEWREKMNYELLEQDEKKAMRSIKAYYKKVGFVQIKGCKDLLFIDTGAINRKIAKINLSELISYQ